MRLFACLSLGFVLMTCAVARGQSPDPSLALKKAEEFYRQDKLFEAEKLLHAALGSNVPGIRSRAYERLLVIYVRLSRPDRALEVGVLYEHWLGQIREPRRIPFVWLQRAESYLALGHAEQALTLARKILDGKTADLTAEQQRAVWQLVAHCHEKTGQAAQATHAWGEVEKLLRVALKDELKPADRLERFGLLFKLAECKYHQGDYAGALASLVKLDPVAGVDDLVQRDYHRMVGQTQTKLGDGAAARKALTEARRLHEKRRGDALTAGDLAQELADAARLDAKAEESARWRKTAIDHYQEVLRDPSRGKPGEAGRVAAFWRLHALYQSTSDYDAALKLTRTQADEWAGSPLVEHRLKFALGRLELVIGSYKEADQYLRAALVELQKQQPPNLVDLPRALHGLAVVDLAMVDGTEAGKKRLVDAAGRVEQSQELYRKYRLPPDRMLADIYNLHGAVAAQSGRYAEAIAAFRTGLEICDRLGPAARSQKSNLLLNVALVHKTQGDLAEALDYCTQAYNLFRRTAEPGDPGHLAYAAALANLYLASGQLAEAQAYAEKIGPLCAKHRIEQGPMFQTGLFCQGLNLMAQREYAQADTVLKRVLAMQEKDRQRVLLPRTLNYLGISADLQERSADAEAYFRRAYQLQKDQAGSYPPTHFITLWQLAAILERQNRRDEARKLLAEAMHIVERARGLVYGAAKQRAVFFAQFATGIEKYIETSIHLGDLEGALVTLMQTRSRTMYDQLQLAGVDPREHLKGAEGAKLVAREREILRTINALKARAAFIAIENSDDDDARKLQGDLDRAKAELVTVWREIFNAAPVYRDLAQQNATRATFTALSKKLAANDHVLLVYHLSTERSHLFLVSAAGIDVYPLEAPIDIARRGVMPVQPATEVALLGSRGVALRKIIQRSYEPAPAPLPKALPTAPLTLATAAVLAEHFRLQLMDPDFKSTRGFRVKAAPNAAPIPARDLALPGNVFLPPPARERIRVLAPKTIIAVPDGPLHQLPLEALLLESGPSPRFVLDELPPIAYAPSLGALAFMLDRPARAGAKEWKLLTICNPAYPQEIGAGKDDGSKRLARSSGIVWHGSLPRLPGSSRESEFIRTLFHEERVTLLEGADATVRKARGAFAGKQIVHIAAHGFAEKEFGNQFGGIALAPGMGKDEDTFLSLHEIYQLPLQDCELAVLSACVTNVGPQEPLEAGVTLASGFLAAGSRRVVASHWSVDDDSTAALMQHFFTELTRAKATGAPVRYAHAIHQARLHIRRQARWSSPYYWAPFVFIGPS